VIEQVPEWVRNKGRKEELSKRSAAKASNMMRQERESVIERRAWLNVGRD
jgi:hypothetical protein